MKVNEECWENREVREGGGDGNVLEAADETGAECHGWGSEAEGTREFVFTA